MFPIKNGELTLEATTQNRCFIVNVVTMGLFEKMNQSLLLKSYTLSDRKIIRGIFSLGILLGKQKGRYREKHYQY